MKSPGVIALVCLAGCGDNSNQCGPGTLETNGVCQPEGAELVCSDGTVLDALTNECVPDPSVCGGGTVLINGQCQDPSAGLTIDLMEGPEPNGFELDRTPAGTINLKAIGEAFVLKGCVTPTGNNSPDLDVYELDVTSPTLLHIAADGVEGLAAGFLVVTDDAHLGSWFRLGINLSTDTSKREVFLPVAGHYQLVMTDSRTLLPITQNGEGFPAAGNPDGTSCYYVTVNQRAIPTPATLDLLSPTVGTIGEDLQFFTATFDTGLITMVAVIDPEDIDGDGLPDLDTLGNPIDSRAASSIVLVNNNELRQINDSGADSPISSAIFGGIEAGDAPLVVLDYVWNYAIGPADFAVEVLDHTTSQALSTTGTAVASTSNGQFFAESGQSNFDNVNLFHFDVAAQGQVDAMDLAFSIPVQGSIVDQDGFFASPFTGLVSEQNGTPAITTFTSYQGLIRSVAPGRYYFFVFAPRDPVATAFTVTSTITTVNVNANTNTIILDGTPAQTAFNNVRSNMFSYDAGTLDPWQTFNVTTGGTTGPVAMSVFDPDVTTPQTPGFAFGRLDTLQTTFNSSPPSTRIGDGTPLIATTLEADGSTPLHVIHRNMFAALPAAPTQFLVKANPTIADPTGTFGFAFSIRDADNFGTIAADQSATGPRTMVAGSEERFYFETTAGNQWTIKVEPTGNQPDLGLVLELLDASETPIDGISGSLGDSIELTRSQNLSGFTAFRVRGLDGDSAGSYTVTVNSVATGYAVEQAPAGFADACPGGSVVAMADVAGFGADDEGVSGLIGAPAGFELFGAAVIEFRVSSNGFLTFDDLSDAQAVPTPLADTSSVAIAPHWDDLFFVDVCTKATATQRIVQWDGFDVAAFAGVQFQAILDANGTITFVYGPAHVANGSTATIGVQGGLTTLQLGFLTPLEGPASSITLTPN